MEVISSDDVPTYLRSGSFFLNLDSSDTETFEVPSDCFKRNPTVTDNSELTFVLQTARFWGLENPPVTVVSYGIRRNGSFHVGLMIQAFPEFRTFLSQVFRIRQTTTSNCILSAIGVGLGVIIVEHLHEQDGFPLSSECFLAAAEHDDAAIIEYLERRGCVWHEKTVNKIVKSGSLGCLKYALKNNHPLPGDIITTAAVHRQKEVLQYLLKNDVKFSSEAVEVVLQQGNIQLVKLLHEAGGTWPEDAAFFCVLFDHLDCLIYAIENGHTFESDLCIVAAHVGSLRCLVYLHLKGRPWDRKTTCAAAIRGHFQCLKFAHQRGCPLNSTATTYALNCGAWRCALYCILHGAVSLDLAYCMFMWALTLLQLVAMGFVTATTYYVCCNTFLVALLYSVKVFAIRLGETYNRYLQGAILVLLLASLIGMIYECYTQSASA